MEQHLGFVASLKRVCWSLFAAPVEELDRPQRAARLAVDTVGTCTVFLLGLTGVIEWVAGRNQASMGERLVVLVLLALAYAVLYRVLLQSSAARNSYWVSIALVLTELSLLALLAPAFAQLAVPLISSLKLGEVTSALDDEFFPIVMIIGGLMFAARGWSRYARRRIQIEVTKKSAELFERLAMEDSLTGLANRRRFEAALADALRPDDRRKTHGNGCALLMLDVNKFKQINDGFSHDMGDEVLKGIGVVMRRCVREGDLPARLAGDEFVVLLTDADESVARTISQRLSAEVASHEWSSLHPALAVSISVGYAVSQPGDQPIDMFRRSDAMMYEVKGGAVQTDQPTSAATAQGSS